MKDYTNLTRAELIAELDRLNAGQHQYEGSADAARLAQDLEVHQVELEMQNLELRDSQRELEEARDLYADLYDFAPIGYITLDDRGVIRALNLTATRQLERSRSQLLNLPFNSLLAKDSSGAFFASIRATLDTNEPQSVELKVQLKNNRTMDIYLQMQPDIREQLPELRVAVMDITSRKKLDLELLAAREAAEEASRASKAKSLFLAHMSHEFRTPLNSILGFAQILEADSKQPLQPQQLQHINHILSSGWHMLQLVNDLLDLVSIESGNIELHPETIELKAVITDCINTMAPLVRESHISLGSSIADTCSGAYIHADPRRFKQVILNLLSNAVKFNHTDGSVVLACEPVATDVLRISVTDTGPGIAQEDIPMLFTPFTRLDSDNRANRGSGIGLSISKQLVESMGGQIGVTSAPGAGSTFWIEVSSCPAPDS